MIRRISSTLPSFKQIDLQPGFNVILAERTKESTKKDTRNGLGKSTLIDVLHFCLGSRFTSGHRLAHPDLRGVAFKLDLDLFGHALQISRSTSDPNNVVISGDLKGLPLPESSRLGTSRVSVSEWNDFLGQYWLGIPVDSPRKYLPTFRSAISYFMRTGKDAYSDPFRHFRMQSTWDIQVNNAFLLGLQWEDASDWQVLKDKRKTLEVLKEAAEEGLIENVWGSRGQLEADRVRLKESVNRTAVDLKNFKVLSQYRELESRADELSNLGKRLSDENAVEMRILEMYKTSIQEEHKAAAANVSAIYESAKVIFPDTVRVRLEEVESFHAQVVENRRRFLIAEVDRLGKSVEGRTKQIQRAHEEQTKLLAILNTHGALDQYSKLQQAHAADVSQLRDVENRLENMKQFEQGRDALKVESAVLEQRARANYEIHLQERERAVALFNSNSEALYKAPGRLMIDISPSGFTFGVDIERKGSTGISNMEIFCYDLMLAERWAAEKKRPIPLIHDSNIYADVDDRQIAAALVLAAEKAKANGFQYICTFNSDKLPVSEFLSDFDIQKFTRLTLTDKTHDGGLLGLRLPPTGKP